MRQLQKNRNTLIEASVAGLHRIRRSINRLIRSEGPKGSGVDLKSSSRYSLAGSSLQIPGPGEKSMSKPSPNEVTQLLLDWRKGDKSALEKLTPMVYDELRRLANYYLKGERQNHTLQGTALVHEVYIKLVGHDRLEWQNRAHFFAFAARLMRQTLVDHARKHRTEKRGGGKRNLSLEEATVFSKDRSEDMIALDDALSDLARLDQRKSRIVEMRYFGGLSIEEIAEVEEISVATVRRQMRLAEAWLHREISKS